MILIIEGPRSSGKTFLIEKFFEQNKDPNITYYKFYFADWVKRLKLQHLDHDKALHYMSLGNILTVLEQMKGSSKIIVFDRAIFSAYVWAIMRKRLPKNFAINELQGLISSDYYRDIHTIYVQPGIPQTEDLERNKDIWDGAHTTKEESELFLELFEEFTLIVRDYTKNNNYKVLSNDFTHNAVDVFTSYLNSYSELR